MCRMATWRVHLIHEPAAEDDVVRGLVVRIWARGVSREDAAIDLWLKEVAPSRELRKWFGHQPERFSEFRERYLHELEGNAAFTRLQQAAKEHKRVTLLYGARDQEHNQAVVLRELLE